MLTLAEIRQFDVKPRSIALWWLGQSGFIIKSPAGRIIVMDPYLSDSCNALGAGIGVNMARQVPLPMRGEELAGVDGYLLTHGHRDHLDPVTLNAYRQAGGDGPFVAPIETIQRLRALNVSEDRCQLVWPNHLIELVVIANAACVVRAPFVELALDDWNRQINLNLTGYFNVAQVAAVLMQKQPPDARGVRGKILLTSSWVGQRPLPDAVAYVVSKAGVDALVQAAAQELSPTGIRVNAVAPGLLYAGLTKKVCDANPKFRAQLLDYIPLNELGTPEQIASAFAFLCSDESNYMTGQVLVIDGGCTVIKRQGT